MDIDSPVILSPEYTPPRIAKKENAKYSPQKTKQRKIIRDPKTPDGMNETIKRISRVPRGRAATEGDDIRPEVRVAEGRHIVGWNVSPSNNPHSRLYSFESTRSITQILQNLKQSFAKYEMELTPETTVVGSGDQIVLKGKNNEGEVEVELKSTSEGHTVALFTRSSNLHQEQFCNLIKELELESSGPEFYVNCKLNCI